MVSITFATHSTTFDNENDVASGWFDVRLSKNGIEQAKELGEHYRDANFDAIFCSDLKRAYQTATIAFSFDPHVIYSDWRLREIDYGQYTQSPKPEVKAIRSQYIDKPFLDGESYTQLLDRIASFLADLKIRWEGKKVLVIGHRGTHFGLEHFIANKSIQDCLNEDFTWQPGWNYELQ